MHRAGQRSVFSPALLAQVPTAGSSSGRGDSEDTAPNRECYVAAGGYCPGLSNLLQGKGCWQRLLLSFLPRVADSSCGRWAGSLTVASQGGALVLSSAQQQEAAPAAQPRRPLPFARQALLGARTGRLRRLRTGLYFETSANPLGGAAAHAHTCCAVSAFSSFGLMQLSCAVSGLPAAWWNLNFDTQPWRLARHAFPGLSYLATYHVRSAVPLVRVLIGLQCMLHVHGSSAPPESGNAHAMPQ